MGPLPFALSVHNFVNSVGADAGFASIIGLAILVLLYFAHARETAVLRNHAQEAAQRIQQLEARLAQLGHPPAAGASAAAQGVQPAPGVALQAPAAGPAVAGQRPVAAPAPTSAAGMAVSRAYPAPAATGAPAGVGAPPLSAATRLIPVVSAEAAAPPGAPPPAAPGQADAAGLAPASPPSGGTNGTGEHIIASRGTTGGSAVAETGAPAAAPTPGPISAAATRATPTAAAARPTPAPRPAAAVRPAVQIRSGSTSAGRVGGLPPRGPAPRQGTAWSARRVLPVLIAALALGAIVAVLLLLTSGGSGTKSGASATAPVSNAPVAHPRPHTKPAFNPSSVTVTVLNGTATGGLARKISSKLTAAGFKQGNVATASDATRTATVVAYMSGHNQDALEVAKALKLGSASVQRIDPSTQAIACPPPAPCAATVVVTVGADLAATP